MTKKVRWGIVSTGGIATKFAQDILHTDNACLVAVGSRKQESADNFAAAHRSNGLDRDRFAGGTVQTAVGRLRAS